MRRKILPQIIGSICILLAVIASVAAAANDLSDAEIQGRNLVEQLLQQRPTDNYTNSGVLKIRSSKNNRHEIPVKFEVIATPTNWFSIYETLPGTNGNAVRLTVVEGGTNSNQYFLAAIQDGGRLEKTLASADTMVPFAGSDFWIADLGLEFFHWPEQKVLKHEMRRGQSCKVLESVNPNSTTNGYSRVVSWIDNDAGAIIHADAYDSNGKLLKVFEPKEFKKVNGQWQLQEIEIRNVKAGSQTRIEFNLEQK